MDDIALINAQLLWNDGGSAIVVDMSQPGKYDRHLISSFDNAVGACFIDWSDDTDAERLARMLSWGWQAVFRDGADSASMNAALSVIPEFRGIMTPDMVPA